MPKGNMHMAKLKPVPPDNIHMNIIISSKLVSVKQWVYFDKRLDDTTSTEGSIQNVPWWSVTNRSLLGVQSNYRNIWEKGESPKGLVNAISELMHWQWGKKLVHGKNIFSVYLQKVRKFTGSALLGGIIHKYAINTMREARKMMSILEESAEAKIMLKVDGEYEFGSGKIMENLIEFILHWI